MDTYPLIHIFLHGIRYSKHFLSRRDPFDCQSYLISTRFAALQQA